MTSVLPRFPGQVKRIDRNTVAAQARSWVESHETKWLCFGCRNHLPNIDSHRVVNNLQLVNERYINATENVFEKFGRFGHSTRFYRDELFDGDPVDLERFCQASGSQAPHNFGNGR